MKATPRGLGGARVLTVSITTMSSLLSAGRFVVTFSGRRTFNNKCSTLLTWNWCASTPTLARRRRLPLWWRRWTESGSAPEGPGPYASFFDASYGNHEGRNGATPGG